jgi:LmbE family N-acetylglucosaminyl deacetylase
MNLHNPGADVYIPDGSDTGTALSRTTHLGIGAHQDDLEIMAYHGIAQCYNRADAWFTGVTCTNGGGSSRSGDYAGYTDQDMQNVRREEQRTAAQMGQYSAMLQLDYPSSVVKAAEADVFVDELEAILLATSPRVVYTHNPADKHFTHIGIVVPVLQALRRLPADARPEQVLGCEVWRNLDWLNDTDKVALNVSDRPHLAEALVGIFDSQIAGGKRYDLATAGRWVANATYFDSHSSDDISRLHFAMDLTPLVNDDSLDIIDFVMDHVNTFADNVRGNLIKRLGG